MKIRRKKLFWFSALIILIFLVGYMSSCKKKVKFRILCMGDSITAGKYPHYLAKYFVKNGLNGIYIKNLGRRGNTSGEYLAFLKKKDIGKKKVDFVLIQLGTNDVRIGRDNTDTAQFLTNIEEIIRFVQNSAPYAQIFLATIPPILKEVPDYISTESRERVTQEINPAVREIAHSTNCKVVEVFSLFEKHPEWFAEDGIHPNKEGYKQLANLWGKTLIPYLKESPSQISYKLPTGFSEQVVFQSDIDGDTELYLLSQKGLRKLTENNFPDENPEFSPDEKRIVYKAKPKKKWQLFIMTLETGKIEEVFPKNANFHSPCWAPDGEAIAFGTDMWGHPELARFDLQKRIIARLTDTDGRNTIPDWSPDGKTIAFTGNRWSGWGVYSLDLSTNKINKLTDVGNCRPDWSPDGNWIAFVSIKGNYSDIHLMRPDGSDNHSLTKDLNHWDYFPSWSRDGKRVYFSKSKKHRGAPWHLYVINSDGSQPFQITYGTNQDRFPDVY